MSDLSQDALTQLKRTHSVGVRLLAEHGFDAEAPEVAIAVERHRWFWRPSKIKVLLVAESHVFTSDADFVIKTDNAKLKTFGRAGATPPPENFVRLVYCLGYGEPAILKNAPVHHRNPGTENYWEIFRRITGEPLQSIGESGSNLENRLRWKLKILRRMCRQGIWLLDAAVHAIYLGNNHRLPPDVQRELHQQWWGGYGRHVVESCGEPKIWVIGKTVFNCLNALPDWHCRGWIYQPNYDANVNWPKLLKDCGQ